MRSVCWRNKRALVYPGILAVMLLAIGGLCLLTEVFGPEIIWSVYDQGKIKISPAKRELRKGIFATPSDIFPYGKVKYFLAEM